ncbi:TfuA-like protein [Kitasatospora sp. NPDC052896]|uniref:TfuA-like protein n=1 Tax=Kitasatospora sp. NPDC052896 TaxID=3364061 RepID=UPI0037C90D29
MINSALKPIVFLGPTGYGLDQEQVFGDQVSLRPPVPRGGVAQVVSTSPAPGIMVIVDGTFHSYPSVGHVEIRDALDGGWQVWGLSSMGAIRAAEMSHLGMRGFGTVFERYATDPDFDDDEVTLIHSGEAPFQPFSEPLVHMRALLDDLVAQGQLTVPELSAVTERLKKRWYAERTLHSLRMALVDLTSVTDEEARAALARIDQFRVKTSDLLRFMEERPWLNA